MKALILNGSPRSTGNTALAAEAIAAGLKGKYEVEIVSAAAQNYRGCMACDGCKKNGGRCVIPDGGEEVLAKIEAADLLVLCTPVYWWGMTAHLKAVLDRLYSRSERLHGTGKKIGVFSVGEAELSDPEYRLIEEQVQCIADYLGWKVAFLEKACACEAGSLAKESIAHLRNLSV